MKSKIYSLRAWCLLLLVIIAILSNDLISDANDRGDFSMDYPKYIGWTIDSTLADAGIPLGEGYVMYFHNKEDGYGYVGCGYRFSNGVRIEFGFDSIIPHPADRENRIMDVAYFQDQKIRHVEVVIKCSHFD